MTSDDANPYASPRPLVELPPELTPGSDAIRGAGALSWEDFQIGVRLALGTSRFKNLFVIGMLLFGISLMLVSGGGMSHPMVMIAMVFLVATFWRAWLQRRAVSGAWAHPNGTGQMMSIAAAADGMFVKTAQSTALQHWPRFAKYRVNARVVVLFYDPPQMFYVIPRTYFATDEAWHAFVDRVASHLPQG